MAHLKNGFTILLLVVLISTLFSQPVHAAKIYDNADDVIKAFYAVKGDISNFQSNIYFARKSSDFLGEVFGAGDLDSIENGTMNYVRPDLYQVILNESGGNKIKFMSADGLNYYAVRVDFEGKPVSIGASTAAAENKKIETVSFRDSPLAFMFPYRSFTIMPGEKFEFMGNETVYSNPCYVIHVNSPFRGEHTIWISHTGLYVMRIDWTDPKDGKIVRALYRDFIPVKEQKFWLYTYMDVTREGKPLYYVEVTGQAANVPREQLAGIEYTPPELISVPRPKLPSEIEEGYEWDPLLGRYVPKGKLGTETNPFTPFQIIVTILMGGGLIYLIWRLIQDLTSREIFSEELMVVDKKKGEFLEKLKSAGIPVIKFTPEKLTEERKIVGIRRSKEKPRAVIIAPDAIDTIRDYLFLLKAYLDEGGRVIILPHSDSEKGKLPFQVATIKYNPEIEGFLVHSRMNIWKHALRNEVEGMLAPHLASEMIVAVDESPVDREILTLHNKRMGIKGSVAGVMKQGKGEILFLQLKLDDLAGLSQKSVLRRTIEDILTYFQNRPVEGNNKEK